ncbi:hypothetical protein [Paenibacillus faecis]|uniref:hypothetical protein n=1 Tax=Paenibacillus faecis TaxID=862114 RepID=UPI001BCF95D9|nr:hypothetical protein [Paenibacillus faecis]
MRSNRGSEKKGARRRSAGKYRPESTDPEVPTGKYRPESTDRKVPTGKYRPESTDRKVQTQKCRHGKYRPELRVPDRSLADERMDEHGAFYI